MKRTIGYRYGVIVMKSSSAPVSHTEMISKFLVCFQGRVLNTLDSRGGGAGVSNRFHFGEKIMGLGSG